MKIVCTIDPLNILRTDAAPAREGRNERSSLLSLHNQSSRFRGSGRTEALRTEGSCDRPSIGPWCNGKIVRQLISTVRQLVSNPKWVRAQRRACNLLMALFFSFPATLAFWVAFSIISIVL